MHHQPAKNGLAPTWSLPKLPRLRSRQTVARRIRQWIMSSQQPNNPGTFRAPSFDDNLGADVTSPGTMALGVGQKVFGHFTLKRLLGQGAMGMV